LFAKKRLRVPHALIICDRRNLFKNKIQQELCPKIAKFPIEFGGAIFFQRVNELLVSGGRGSIGIRADLIRSKPDLSTNFVVTGVPTVLYSVSP
jgi:hypothetical protein